jgi:hypothetical protein
MYCRISPILVLIFGLTGIPAFGWIPDLAAEKIGEIAATTPGGPPSSLPDFSYVGYKEGRVGIPEVRVYKKLSAVDGDNAGLIQSAINELAREPVGDDGYRGAIVLAAGEYRLRRPLVVNASGIVIRGVGRESGRRTLLVRKGGGSGPVIRVGDPPTSIQDEPAKSSVDGISLAATIDNESGSSRAPAAGGDSALQPDQRLNNGRASETSLGAGAPPGAVAAVTTACVPINARKFNVDRPDLFSVGEPVLLIHPSTDAWLNSIENGGTHGRGSWVRGHVDITYNRRIESIQGQEITLDAPVYNPLVREMAISRLKRDRVRICNVGIEDLAIDIAGEATPNVSRAGTGLRFAAAEDSWVRRTEVRGFSFSGIEFVQGCVRCTAADCSADDPVSDLKAKEVFGFRTNRGQLILIRQCQTSSVPFAYTCGGGAYDSGIVFFDCAARNCQSVLGAGLGRWTHGILFDHLRAADGADSPRLELVDYGSRRGHGGWGTANSVAWNCDVAKGAVIVQNPPTARNYAIGCMGKVSGTGMEVADPGYIEGANRPGLAPESLYLAQLRARLGLSSPSPD